MSDHQEMTPDEVRDWARVMADSPLYVRLIEVIASDAGLMRVLNRVENTPKLNVLLAGVQFLMIRDGGAALARHYPNFTDDPVMEGVEASFTDFILAREEDLVTIGRTRYTQTNECRRCVALLAGIWETPARSFHLIDVGTSAGLNLLLDRYHCRFGDVEWGPRSPVVLTTESRGREVAARNIEILSRAGLDLHPVDPTNSDDARWLEALVWPEQQERRQRLRAALELAAQDPPTLISGDVVETLPRVLSGLPRGEPAVVMNSFILNQLSREGRHAITSIIGRERRARPVYRVSYEWLSRSDDAAAIHVDDGSGLRRVGMAHPHGEWVELYARP